MPQLKKNDYFLIKVKQLWLCWITVLFLRHLHKYSTTSQRITGIPRFIVLSCTSQILWVFFPTNWRFLAILCQTSLSVPLFQQHLLTSCLSHFWSSQNISNFLIIVNICCDQWSMIFDVTIAKKKYHLLKAQIMDSSF